MPELKRLSISIDCVTVKSTKNNDRLIVWVLVVAYADCDYIYGIVRLANATKTGLKGCSSTNIALTKRF